MDGYPYKHRKGSPLCEHNPNVVLNRAMNSNISDDDLEELRVALAWANEGGVVGGEPPF
ncbi:hypothetical protein Lumi_075 [Xylophilus phage Lumi]|nr:hypothetical protein Lumi_075 [Xylophilus phage Lumi]